MQAINAIKDIKWQELYTDDKINILLAVGSTTVIGLFSYLTLIIYLNKNESYLFNKNETIVTTVDPDEIKVIKITFTFTNPF